MILGEGQGAVAKASLIGISSRVRDQFLSCFRYCIVNSFGECSHC